MAAHRSLQLTPFRAVRYSPDRVGDVGAVTSLPYDMYDPTAGSALGRRRPYNIVNLILPESGAAGAAGERLAAWLDNGVLTRDPLPALYAYEQRDEDLSVLQRGVLGAVELRAPEEGVILPHEDTSPGPVEGRLELLRACRANLEPLLLLHRPEDTNDHSDIETRIDEAIGTEPMLDVVTSDRVRHRIWPVVDPTAIADISAELADRRALIGDGHHRYAAALRWQAEQRAAGRGSGPWDHVLALLVDESRYPIQVGPIHRVARGLDLDTVLAAVQPELAAERVAAGTVADLLAVADGGPHGRFLITDGTAAYLLRDSNSRAGSPLGGAESDAAFIDGDLLTGRLGVAIGRLSHPHSVSAAVSAAEDSAGVAFLLRSVDSARVFEVAADGGRLPRKSTSITPKVRAGLLIRTLTMP